MHKKYLKDKKIHTILHNVKAILLLTHSGFDSHLREKIEIFLIFLFFIFFLQKIFYLQKNKRDAA